MSAADRTDDPRSRVELRLAAAPDRLPVVRAAAEAFALLAGFDIDAVADLKLAVDEACSELATRAAAGTELTCVFSCESGGMGVTVSAVVSAHAGEAPLDSGFGWHVLRTLTDEARVGREDAGVMVIEFVKRR
ncbi:ATP-binding protein [Rhodococcus sp. D2-41]|uniref:ATP-binding protein n=1 Tax=Speluncibacter jeojiensis TaxID=2710754 RepID=UPI00240FC8EB|nr:ATP-binding protein [Rhodococcus sp. D2-41]MDG3010788.1 ATP-binding protein [Rhodococcus sp. D2-41]